MKKYILASGFILALALGIYQGNMKNNRIPELILQNIECLATSENPNTHCFGRGTVDCPINNDQVVFYL